MKTRNMLIAICALLLCGSIYSCGGPKTGGGDDDIKTVPAAKAPLNISIYLDLSDRLIRTEDARGRKMNLSQKDRDLAIIDYIADCFKEQTSGPQILQSKNNIKVFFYPAPDNSGIATLAADLSLDIMKYQGKDKRIALDEMKEKFMRNLDAIYDKTIQANNWTGCDIWDFFSNKNVDTQCIRKGFRNILVILTDGYLYDKYHKMQDGNSYSYITSTTLKDKNASLIVKRTGLEDLEVCILEVNPYDINHRDQLVLVLENWLKAMGVQEITVAETDLPVNTQTIIKSFLEN